ncbi:UNVERIFIED_CONTAM: hypothetical protein Slati_3620900 [Sesamum latifolium]|uniref:DNA-directed RNA polymerase III subunit n=1 Tax=Sesamum latifolium TaxID=2727402 RepID=A0AAW2U0J5_9LAMI
MAFRGRGRGRGGFGGGGFRPAKQEPLELFPEIEGLGTAEYSTAQIELIKWSSGLHKYWNSSPYYYEDRSERPEKVDKPDIERYSDRNLHAGKVKPPLWHFIKLDADHVPAELARGEKKQKLVKRVRWNPESDLQKLDLFEKLEQKHQGQEGTEKKENEEEEEEDGGNEEDEGEFSDEGDYEQAEYCDDDEDDFNMADDNNGMLCLGYAFCFLFASLVHFLFLGPISLSTYAKHYILTSYALH